MRNVGKITAQRPPWTKVKIIDLRLSVRMNLASVQGVTMGRNPVERGSRGLLTILLVTALLAGLPIAVWLDLIGLSDVALRRQASDVNAMITSVREYYATNVVARVLAAANSTPVAHNYESVSGAIPIPAEMSLELGRVISEGQHNIAYRFVSDLPFKNRAPHVPDDFEMNALAALRADPKQQIIGSSWSILTAVSQSIAGVESRNS
jgi:adenylate cyclase